MKLSVCCFYSLLILSISPYCVCVLFFHCFKSIWLAFCFCVCCVDVEWNGNIISPYSIVWMNIIISASCFATTIKLNFFAFFA